MCTKLQTVRRKAASLVLAGMLAITGIHAQSYTDVALIASIAANAASISAEMTATNKLQTSILGENVVISGLLTNIYDYEKKMYDYMSKAQDIVTSAYTIGKCFDMGVEIVEELNNCRREAQNHPQGLIVSSLVTDQYSDIYNESAALVSYLTPIIRGNGESNLLNSAERIRILNSVRNRLYNILFAVKTMKMNIQRMRLCHLVDALTPDYFIQYNDTQEAYNVALEQLRQASRVL